MSECVVRMEMPKACWFCGLRFVCKAANDFLTTKETGCSVLKVGMEGCLIVCQLPEGHGRLVDEKEVKDWVENWLCVNKYYHPYSSSKSIPVSELYDVLQRMDAAVQAERSET